PISGEVGLEGILTARVNVFKIPQKTNLVNDASDSIDEFLINSDGYFISKPVFANKIFELNLVKKRPELELSFFKPNLEFSTKILHSNSLETVLDLNGHTNYVGEVVISSISPVKGTNWLYVSEIEKSDAYDDIVRLQTILILSTSLIVISVSAASIIFANRLLRPIKTLTHVIAIASNENNIIQLHSEYFLQMSADNEISKLYTTFYRLMRSVENSTKALRDAEKKYRTLYEDLPDLCRTINEEGIIMDCNNSYANSLGYSKEEIIGKTIFEHTAEQSIAALHDSFETWRERGAVTSREIWFKRKDGSIFPALLNATNLYDDTGKRIGSNTVIRDISDIYDAKKELEEQKTKRLSALGELCARIAHDMKNPLSVLKNTVEIMQMRNVNIDEKTKNDFNRLDRAITRIQHQVDDVLDFVRPKSMILKSCTVHEILEASMERMLVPPGVDIILPENDTSILCDAEKIEVVFTNLMTNAIQAMSNRGKITIRIMEGEDEVRIEVADSGPGIPQEILPKIFDPLFTT
ncbi:MAG: two-component system sensor histidine kinase NtrB, partial [Nitrososphaeraceae archaeon]